MRLVTGCIIEANGEKYHVHFLNVSRTYEFKHIEHHKTYHLNNCTKDKIKTEEQVAELLKYNVIRIISIPSIYFEIWQK